jgi:hypothetical protein
MTTTFAVDRADLRRAQWLESATAPLESGAVRLRIDRFALTSNNVTHGTPMARSATHARWRDRLV